MRFSTALACLFSFLFVACSSDLESAQDEFGGVARGYVEAWCRGDGSVEREQFQTEELPELFRKWSQTIHTLPVGSPVEHFEVEGLSVSGPGKKPELLEYGFDLKEEAGFGFISEQVHCIAIVFQVRLADGSQHRGQVAIRPDVPFVKGQHHQVKRSDRWRAMPLRP